MTSDSSSSSHNSAAAQSTFRSENLDSASIYFINPHDPAPIRIKNLQAAILNLEGIDRAYLANLFGDAIFRELEDPANYLLPGPEKARYEASFSIAQQCGLALKQQKFEAVKSLWMPLNMELLQAIRKEGAFEVSGAVPWDVEIRPEASPISPIQCARPDRGFGFTPSRDPQAYMSKRTLRGLAEEPRIRLIYSAQRCRELIFPFCVYECNSATEGTIMFAENRGAVGVATAAAVFSELAKLSGTTPSTSPPVFMLASSGYVWTIHACIAETVGHTEQYHVYPVTEVMDLRVPMQLFLFQVYLSRIRDYVLSSIKPWINERLAEIIAQNNIDEATRSRDRSR